MIEKKPLPLSRVTCTAVETTVSRTQRLFHVMVLTASLRLSKNDLLDSSGF